MTRPLGITVEEAIDKTGLVYISKVGEKAEEAGIEVGDIVSGVSAVYGNWMHDVLGEGAERVMSLVRTRDEDYITLELHRGYKYHLDEEEIDEEIFETDLDYRDKWEKIYSDEYIVDMNIDEK
eukprot:CAMPEP_0113938116 /NCGR_PEP_ID=MMETSP1339-20121228/4521_1 /TAXON_ID=94617 /ORGANISM="Fibrocapsa japonica" /LENGTH=122 /DNA_ID=CAMNT_0000941063 /DNA_START=338 /DNA_END=706 /DNA_ORIENTATION=- /assembly_acc=CAM_ASM_000762